MFGIRFIKMPPTTYVLQYQSGKLKREGQGLAFFYFSPLTSLVAIPLESVDVPFIFKQVSADFQEISIQGQVTYRIADPKQLAQLLNFTLDNSFRRNYVSDDPTKFPQRLINLVQVLMQSELGQLSLREALTAGNLLVQKVRDTLRTADEVKLLGLEILGLSILSIKPNPDTAHALEAEVREQLLKEADQAIYARRNAAVEQERTIKENELNTEIAVEHKKRQVREAQMEAERSVKEKQRQIQEEEMTGKISLEARNKELVNLTADNLRCEADAKAYGLTATMTALAGVDAKVLQALASMDMNPNQLIALAFRDLAAGAEKIGELNVSPDLLRELLDSRQPQPPRSKK